MHRTVIHIAIIITVFSGICDAQVSLNDKKVSANYEHITVREALNSLYNDDSISFIYLNDMQSLDKKISVYCEKCELKSILDDMFSNTDLQYQFLADKVMIREKKKEIRKYNIKGRILNKFDNTAVEYASMQIGNLNEGTIANQFGQYSIEFTSVVKNDTLNIYALGYQSVSIPISRIAQFQNYDIYLDPIVYELQPVEIAYIEKEIRIIGNSDKRSKGSIYIDTNGQQTALLIDNKENRHGKIESIYYYLSVKGNTNAPFRVRLYHVDELTGKPGTDLLKEVIVVKPKIKSGWYKVDIKQFDIDIPENGFYGAIEGVYPIDFDYEEQIDEFIELSNIKKDFPSELLSYGQRIGFSNLSANNTWYYSLTKTWFQFNKKKFNVMIYAEVSNR